MIDFSQKSYIIFNSHNTFCKIFADGYSQSFAGLNFANFHENFQDWNYITTLFFSKELHLWSGAQWYSQAYCCARGRRFDPPLRPCRVALTENLFQRVSWSNSNEIVTRPIRSSVYELDTIVA